MSTPRLTLLPLLVLAASVVLLALPLAAQAPPDPEAPGLATTERLERLLARIKWEQERLKSLQATFEQTKSSALLLQPETSQGRLWLQPPDKARWDFSSPEKTMVLLTGDTMLTWHLDRKKAEKLAIGGQADRAMQYVTASSSLENLQRYFTLKVVFPRDAQAPFQLELKPRFDRVAKRIASMTLHLDRKGYWPVYLRYVEPGGASTELRFADVQLNAEIAAEVFAPVLPPDVKVETAQLGAKSGSR